jgi:hypothetical protein
VRSRSLALGRERRKSIGAMRVDRLNAAAQLAQQVA